MHNMALSLLVQLAFAYPFMEQQKNKPKELLDKYRINYYMNVT